MVADTGDVAINEINGVSEDRLSCALEYLRDTIGLHDFDTMVERIRAGDRTAQSEYRQLSLSLTYTSTWSEWRGQDSPDTICRALNTIVQQAEAQYRIASTPAPPAPYRPITLPQSQPLAAPDCPTPTEEYISDIRNHTDPTVFLSAKSKRRKRAARSTEFERSQSSDTPSSLGLRWRQYARAAGFDPKWLTPAAIEILDMVSRVLIAGAGWGLRDPMRGLYRQVVLSPSRISRHGQAHDRRTYQRQCTHLIGLGLLLELGQQPNGARVVAPAWWEPHYTTNGFAIWVEAARRFQACAECLSGAAVVPQFDSKMPQSCHTTPLSSQQHLPVEVTEC